MPTPFDLLSQKLDDEADPDDQLRLAMGQDQGANLAGGPDAQPNGSTPPSQGGVGPPPGAAGAPQPVAPSPNVPGPLAALAKRPGKPHIRLKNKSPPPNVKKIKPRIKLKASAYGRTI
jgi:hypothetical protein